MKGWHEIMADKKLINLKGLASGLSEKAKSGFETAKENVAKARETVSASADSLIRSLDQTGDGKFDLEDIAELKRQLQEKQRQEKLSRDLDALNPIFPQNLSDGGFLLSKMIRLAEIDKKHASNIICEGSIGHETLAKDLRIVTVYLDKVNEWGLSFYPDNNQEFYYMNPVNPQQYIAIDYFFDYLRQARVGELQRIAQDLGASYFKVTIKEQKKTLHKKSESALLSGKAAAGNAKAQGSYSSAADELSAGEIAAETSFEGHAPIRPQLVFFKNEPQIKALVEMRLENKENAITEQHLFLKCTHSSGITEKVAANLDAAFSAMKCAGNTSFSSEAQNEVRQVFEYDIKF